MSQIVSSNDDHRKRFSLRIGDRVKFYDSTGQRQSLLEWTAVNNGELEIEPSLWRGGLSPQQFADKALKELLAELEKYEAKNPDVIAHRKPPATSKVGPDPTPAWPLVVLVLSLAASVIYYIIK